MPWEKRGKNKYFYKKVKQPDGKWKKTYFGKGLRADVEAMLYEKQQAQKRMQRNSSKRVADAKAAVKRQEKSTSKLVDLMMAGDGYHNPDFRGLRKISKAKLKNGANPMDDKQPNEQDCDMLDVKQCIERTQQGDASVLQDLKKHIQENPQLITENVDLTTATHHK